MSTPDAARPSRPSHRVDVDRPLCPLARATLTFNSPGEPGFLASIEVIVLDGVDGMATAMCQLPEGQAAGWCGHSLGPLSIWFRTIC